MSRDADRFNVAEDQVERFLGRIPSLRRSSVSFECPRDPEPLARHAVGAVPLHVEWVPRLTDRVAAREMWKHHHRPRWDDDEALMGRIVVYRNVVVIFVSTAFPRATARFTLAHEVGHLAIDALPRLPHANQLSLFRTPAEEELLALRRDVPGIVPMDEEGRRPAVDLREYYANLFAAELLMPRKEVGRRVDGIASPEERVALVMRDFDVSRAAARVRLQMLGLMEGRDDAMGLFEAP